VGVGVVWCGVVCGGVGGAWGVVGWVGGEGRVGGRQVCVCVWLWVCGGTCEWCEGSFGVLHHTSPSDTPHNQHISLSLFDPNSTLIRH
jgi:hypothetical protein